MSNLFNLGRMGLNVAQSGLNTTGHNIANVNTPGYSRQQVLVSTAGGQGSASGYFGKGVQVDTVRRIHDSFLANQVNASATVGSALATYANQIGHINNLLADRTVGVAPALTDFFSGLNAVASNPADPASRQELIGRANSLATQLNTTQQFLNEQQRSVNEQLATTVTQINSYAERIRELNARIVEAGAVNGGAHTPNDLLDQRDQLVAELNDLVRVTVIPDGDSINLSVGNGQILLAGDRVFPLVTQPSAADPTRTAVAYTTPAGIAVELNDSAIDGGSLGGLLQFRREALDAAQNELGRVAIGLAMTINQQHAQGVDANGNQAITVSGVTGGFDPAAPADPFTIIGQVSNVGQFGNAADSYVVSFDPAAVAPATGWSINDGSGDVELTADQVSTDADGNYILAFAGMSINVGPDLPATAGEFTIDTHQMQFFSLGSPVVFGNAGNSSNAMPEVSYTDASKLTLDDYRITYDGTGFTVTRHPGGGAVTPEPGAPAGVLRFDGLEVALPDPAGVSANDSWVIQPTRQGARDIGVAIERPDQIAAADLEGGSANGENALKLAALQTAHTLAGGSMSITGGYSQLVNAIGVKTQSVQSASKAQDTLTYQSYAAHQAVSGVNLNEEYINLDYHIQHYNASARLIEVATNLFDTLLGLRT